MTSTVVTSHDVTAAPQASSKPDKPVVVRQRIAVFASTEVDKQLAQGADVCDDEKKEKPEAPQSRGVLEHVKEALCKLFTPIVVESFLLTFVAEWGDRSQMATIGCGPKQANPRLLYTMFTRETPGTAWRPHGSEPSIPQLLLLSVAIPYPHWPCSGSSGAHAVLMVGTCWPPSFASR